jgi:hypothetical protein
LSLGGRLTLLNSCLSNVPLYMLSIYPIPKSVIRKVDIYRKQLLWQGGHQPKKFHLVNWSSVCSPKSQGGLGVLNLEYMNDSLLTKWLWNIENSNGLWQKIISEKYIKGKPLISVRQKQDDSHFWKKILSLRDNFYKYCKVVVGNGMKTSLWKSSWTGDLPLATKVPILFDLAYDKDISVNKVLCSNFEVLSFRRRIIGNLSLMFEDLLGCCNNISLSDQDDRIVWCLGKKGFSVNSLYKKKVSDQVAVSYKFLWKSKLPQKIKKIIWLVVRNKILTKDNLKKINWKGSQDCCFVGAMKQLIIYSFTVPLQDTCGE